MNYFHFLMLFVFLVLGACSNDPTDDKALVGQREALLSTDAMGIYVNGSSALRFDKMSHQLSLSPSKFRFRLMDNAGMQYVEITLSAMPQEGKPVSAELRSSGFKVSDKKMQDVVLLKREDDRLWLWSDATRTGLILPWIEL